MMEINILAVLTAALVAFMIGGFWYSSKIFGKLWARYAMPPAVQGAMKTQHKPMVFIVSFIFYLISAWAFAILIGPDASLLLGVYAGAAIGVLFVATCFGINYLFSGRSVILLLIDGGYHIVQFIIYGIVLGIWH